MRGKKIWVTGSHGFIGSHLICALKEDCEEVQCFTHCSGGESRPSREDACMPMDYSNKSDIKRKVDLWGLPDLFIHIGWGAMTDPEAALHLEENVVTGKALVGTLFESGLKKFVFLGTMNEYGARVGLLSENMKPEGRLTNYARGKAQVAEFGFQMAKHHRSTFIHIRSFYVFGPGQRSGSLINSLYCSYKQGQALALGPCDYYRDYIYVADVVEGIRRISNIDRSTTVNLGSGNVIKLKDFVTLFWETLGGNKDTLKFGSYPMRPGEPDQPRSYADLTRLKELTDWAPSRPIEEGIALTIKELNEPHCY